jgi:CRP-like cAMP-binding protein
MESRRTLHKFNLLIDTEVTWRWRSFADSTAHTSALGRIVAPIKQFGADARVFAEGEPANFIYEVIHGAVRTVKAVRGGRRQIRAFYFPGEIFGFEEGGQHPSLGGGGHALNSTRRRALLVDSIGRA